MPALRWLTAAALVFAALPCSAYSVLSHEAIIDALWEAKLKPALLAHYPNATPAELKTAHGYAYGGAIIQDLGYYPHGSPQFSDLTHYARTGDFIIALVKESRSLNDLAFAFGAMSHYVADVDGHRYATNVAEPMLYPKLRKKFGDVVTYEDNPAGHLKTEYAFDVVEVAKGNFAPQAYHDFIGFYVSEDLVARAVRDTYGLEMTDLFKDFHRAIESYRHAVSKTIPAATRIAWASFEKDIQKSEPGVTRRRFVYVMSRSSYEREWGKQYDRPTEMDRFLAFVVKLLPPIGPLKALRLKMLTPPTEDLFLKSFDRASKQYAHKIDEAMANDLHFEDRNYDVGVVTPAGVYRLDDNVQAFWLDLLAKKNFATVTPSMRSELLAYYSNLDAPIATKKDAKKWARLVAQVHELQSAPVQAAAAGGQ